MTNVEKEDNICNISMFILTKQTNLATSLKSEKNEMRINENI